MKFIKDSIIAIIGIIIVVWWFYFLFHYDHKYKAVNSSNYPVYIYSMNEFEVGDSIKYFNTDFSDNIQKDNAPYSAKITKVLR